MGEVRRREELCTSKATGGGRNLSLWQVRSREAGGRGGGVAHILCEGAQHGGHARARRRGNPGWWRPRRDFSKKRRDSEAVQVERKKGV